MEIQSHVNHRIVGATLQLLKPYKAIMPSHWANAHEGLAVRPQVEEATPPHPYNPQGLLVGPLPHHQETFYLSTKSWGQINIFP
jgi:hypothetical protein